MPHAAHNSADTTNTLRRVGIDALFAFCWVVSPGSYARTGPLHIAKDGATLCGIQSRRLNFDVWEDGPELDLCLHCKKKANVQAVPAAAGGSGSTQEPCPPLGTSA